MGMGVGVGAGFMPGLAVGADLFWRQSRFSAPPRFLFLPANGRVRSTPHRRRPASHQKHRLHPEHKHPIGACRLFRPKIRRANGESKSSLHLYRKRPRRSLTRLGLVCSAWARVAAVGRPCARGCIGDCRRASRALPFGRHLGLEPLDLRPQGQRLLCTPNWPELTFAR